MRVIYWATDTDEARARFDAACEELNIIAASMRPLGPDEWYGPETNEEVASS